MARSALIEPLRRSDPAEIGGYALVGRLGAGAMGQVYLGRSAAGRLVAVKTIKVEHADEADFRTRFAQEVTAARRVSGAFTAAVVAADPDAEVPWLATAYVPAPSLSALIRACGPLSVPAVRWLAAGCAEALESIHGAGLIHRDLKPSNVLVSPDGPRVIDFGLARVTERIQLTLTRGSVGTPAYMAPEQARDSRQATSASDIYSLGATMLFAATGHAPYRGETVMDVFSQLATGPPDLDGLPADLADIVAACLERDPAIRPTSASVVDHMSAELGHEDGALDIGHALLSGPARALIADYRRGLRPLAQPDAEASAEDTLGSLAAYGQFADLASPPAPASLADPGADHGRRQRDRWLAGHRGPDRNPGPIRDRRAPAGPMPGLHDGRPPGLGLPDGGAMVPRPPGGRSGRRAFELVAICVAALALLAGGTAIGSYLASSTRGQPRSTGSSSPGSTGRQQGRPNGRPNAGGTTLGANGPQPGLLPPEVNVRARAARTGRPAMDVNQPCGDPHTSFVVLGAGYPPGVPITVRLAGVGASHDHLVADRAGLFNFVINQGADFFPGTLPTGRYRVVVTIPGGPRRTARFVVSLGCGPPPGV